MSIAETSGQSAYTEISTEFLAFELRLDEIERIVISQSSTRWNGLLRDLRGHSGSMAARKTFVPLGFDPPCFSRPAIENTGRFPVDDGDRTVGSVRNLNRRLDTVRDHRCGNGVLRERAHQGTVQACSATWREGYGPGAKAPGS